MPKSGRLNRNFARLAANGWRLTRPALSVGSERWLSWEGEFMKGNRCAICGNPDYTECNWKKHSEIAERQLKMQRDKIIRMDDEMTKVRMSWRNQLAGMVLQGFVQSVAYVPGVEKELARRCVVFADALMQELEPR